MLSIGAHLAAFAILCLGVAAHADTRVRITDYTYDAAGLPLTETREPTVLNECLQTTYVNDARGNRTSASSVSCAGASGYAVQSASTARVTTTGYDAQGRFPTSSTNPMLHAETRLHEPTFGNVTSLTGPNGLTTTWTYDALGRKTRETRADGTVTTWQYKLCAESGANCPSSVGSAVVVWVTIEQAYRDGTLAVPNAPEKRDFYDKLNRVVRSQTYGYDGVSAAPVLAQDFKYSSRGLLVDKSNWYVLSSGNPVWTSFAYDPLERQTGEFRPDPMAAGGSADTLTAYSGATVVVINPKGQTRTTVRNALEQVVQVQDAQNNTITYGYDALGNLVSTTVAGALDGPSISATTTMAYDLRGNKLSMADPSMGNWQYGYNAFNERVYQQNSVARETAGACTKPGRRLYGNRPALVRDQVGAALGSANVPRPSASSFISLRRAPHRPDPAGLVGVLPTRTHHVRCRGAWLDGVAK